MLHILNKHLTNERAWLRNERLGAIDPKYREGARMAKERIPQFEKAIEILTNAGKPVTVKAEPIAAATVQVIKRKTVSLFSVFKKKI